MSLIKVVGAPPRVLIPGTVEFEICGLLAGVWFKPSVYGVPLIEVIGRYEIIEKALMATWTAFAESVREQVGL
jgi:hypothetical protein